MPQSETLSLSFSILDGDEPKHWSIWNVNFATIDQLVRAIRGHISPYPTQSEFNLLDQTAQQLFERDNWTNVVGTIVHMTDEEQLRHLRGIHKKICHYLKNQPGAVCRQVGYYIVPVAESALSDDGRLTTAVIDFVDDASKALGKRVAEFAPTASSQTDLKNSLRFVARRIVYLREVASDQ